MIKKVVSIFLLCSLSVTHAQSVCNLPRKMDLTERWINTTSHEIEADDNFKVGAIYRRAKGSTLRYDYYDEQNLLRTTSKARYFPTEYRRFGTHFDIFDASEHLVGTMEEELFLFHPKFVVYSPEGTKLAYGERNFFSAYIKVYDALTDTPIVSFSRSWIFRNNENWTITLLERDIIQERQIDINVLLTALALQGDYRYRHDQQSELMEQQRQAQQQHSPLPVPKKNTQHAVRQTDLSNTPLMSAPELQALAVQLEEAFQANVDKRQGITNAEPTEDDFIAYCHDVVNTAHVVPATKKAVLHLLEQRRKKRAGGG